MVEDCEVTAMATQCMFQEMGLWIDSVVDGEAGMRTLSGAATYDLILLDVNLPNMSGYALCSWYKEHCRTHDMRPATVVAVTSDPDREVCFEFGFDHVLPKPLTAVACYKRPKAPMISLAASGVWAKAFVILTASAISATAHGARITHRFLPAHRVMTQPKARHAFQRG